MRYDSESYERRRSERFPLDQPALIYAKDKGTGVTECKGRVVNMSSSGILFTTEREFPLGRRLEIAVAWPTKLDGRCPLKLVVRGRVVRCEGNQVAVEIERSEFRTRGSTRFED